MPDEADSAGWLKQLGEATPVIIATGALVVSGAALKVWAGMDVIQTQITNIVKSDNTQDVRIEKLRDDQNTLKVEVGILNSILIEKK